MKNNILQIIATKYGGTEVLEASSTDSAPLNDKEIRIEVHAAGVNFADILLFIAVTFIYLLILPHPLNACYQEQIHFHLVT